MHPIRGHSQAALRVGENLSGHWLHVFTMTYDVGGHTTFLRRWIEQQDGDDVHDVVLTHQFVENASAPLRRIVDARGGRVVSLMQGPGADRLLGRAAVLRGLLRRGRYRAAVLHHHPWDPVPSLSFSEESGPPVLLLNHADHVFGLGSSVIDMALNLRGLSEHMTHRFRGIERNFLLPAPLPTICAGPSDRLAARRDLAIPASTTVLLTVGTGGKYSPMENLDFPATALQLVRRMRNALLIAVGPEPSAKEWTRAIAESDGRIRATGRLPDVRKYLSAADLYLEGFPFGSTTALLEAGQMGLFTVRAPAEVPALFKAGSPAIDLVEEPGSVSSYVDTIHQLGEDSLRRRQLCAGLKATIEAAHSREAFNSRIQDLRGCLNFRHTPSAPIEVPAIPSAIDRYWTRFVTSRGDAFRRAFLHAF